MPTAPEFGDKLLRSREQRSHIYALTLDHIPLRAHSARTSSPLNLTVLLPCVAPKFEPVMVTAVPTTPDVGDIPLIDGPMVNVTPLLAAPPIVTTTAPVVAPAGTGAAMLVLLQLLGAAVTPLNFTVLVP